MSTYQDIERFRNVVAARLGLAFDAPRSDVLARVLRARLDAHGGGFDAYLQRLDANRPDRDELGRIARELTVTETYFYRGADQFHVFVDAMRTRLAARRGARSFRVLSAGCASGEEPYSVAIAVNEALPEAVASLSIEAVDVNSAMLEKARSARYTRWSLRDLPEALRERWFRQAGQEFELHAAIRSTVRFAPCNLADSNDRLWQPGSWDAVFCRNVLMYFEPGTARALVARIARALSPGGLLFLGHAETLRGLSQAFHLCHAGDTFYYSVRDAAAECDDDTPAVRDPEPSAPVCDGSTAWIDRISLATRRVEALARAVQPRPGRGVDAPDAARDDLLAPLESLGAERFERGLAEVRALPAARARVPDALLLRAVLAAHSGALDDAEDACRELLGRDEMSAGARYVLALCRESRGDPAGAAHEDRLALHLDPEFAMARLHAGLLARRRGDAALARHELERALASLAREDPSRILLFGGGFAREALLMLCRTELARCASPS